MTMTKTYHHEFNNPKDVTLYLQKKYDKIVLAELHFKDTGLEHNLKLHHPKEPMRYDEGLGQIRWDDLKRHLSDVQIKRIVVHKESGLYSLEFYQNHEVAARILCKDIKGLPQSPHILHMGLETE